MATYRTLQMQSHETNDQINDVHVYEMAGVNGSSLSSWDANAVTLDQNLVLLDHTNAALDAFTTNDVDGYPEHVNAADSVVLSGASIFFEAFTTTKQFVWDFWLFVPSSAILRDVDANNESGAFYLGNQDGVLTLADTWDSYNDITETAQTGLMNSGVGLKIGRGLKRCRFYILQTTGDVGVDLEISYDNGANFAKIDPNWVFQAVPVVSNEAVAIDQAGQITKVGDGSVVTPDSFTSLNNFNLDLGWFGEPNTLELYAMMFERTTAMIDLYVDPSSNETVVIEDAHAVAQHIGQRIHTFYGEWYLDTDIGVQWLQEVMAKKGQQGVIIAEQLLRSEILATPGARDIQEIDLKYDHSTRGVLTNSLFIETDFDVVVDATTPF